MQPLLFDEGLPGGRRISAGLTALKLDAHCVGDPGAPPVGSPDDDNCRWCAQHKAVLVTHDRGKKNKEILEALDQHQVGAVMVLKSLRSVPPHEFARAVLVAEGKMDVVTKSGKRLRHHLRPGGGLTKIG